MPERIVRARKTHSCASHHDMINCCPGLIKKGELAYLAEDKVRYFCVGWMRYIGIPEAEIKVGIVK